MSKLVVVHLPDHVKESLRAVAVVDSIAMPALAAAIIEKWLKDQNALISPEPMKGEQSLPFEEKI